MAFVVKDRVKETTTTTGTGTLTLAGAVSGFRSFADVGNANTCPYVILEGSESAPTAWEVGIGTYTASGTTLARTTVLANSAGTTSAITLASGTHTVFCGLPADRYAAIERQLSHAYVSATGTTSASNVTFTEIVTNSETYDKEGWHNTTTGRTTPTRAGFYLVIVKVAITGLSDTQIFIAATGKNGSATIQGRSIQGSGGDIDICVSTVTYCNGSTDYISAFGYQNSGGSKNITARLEVFFLGDNY